MSTHTWQLVLVAVLAFAAGIVLRELVWLVTWSWRKRPDGSSFGATGKVHPGEAVVFDWSDQRPTFGRGAIAVNADGELGKTLATTAGPIIAPSGFGQVPAGQTRHLAAVPDEHRTHLP